CAYLDVCGGGLRARAEAATGDIWAAEPACYLTDEEISGQTVRNQQPTGEQHGH
ncbi:MAG: 12,18-didecarboxysiroheme deacetylase, partial [Planctomycetota bacterium]